MCVIVFVSATVFNVQVSPTFLWTVYYTENSLKKLHPWLRFGIEKNTGIGQSKTVHL